jgi:holo-[acyl-carrier protein] synthase
MILGIGLDVCEIARIEQALATAGAGRFRARVYTATEIAYCDARAAASTQSYAAMFAAKEAVLKALGTGWGKGLGWQAIEVTHDAAGAPAIVLHGTALALARKRGVARVHVSLSHAGGLAVAMVVMEGDGAAAPARVPRPKSRRRTR